MLRKFILLAALFSLTACADYYRAQADAQARDIAEKQAEVDQIVATSHATVREQMAHISMNVTVCTAKANAAVPGAGDMVQPVTMQDRARLIKWAKVSDSCFAEKGETLRSQNYPAMEDMKQCDRESQKDMPSASIIQRNSYIDDCLEARGFDLPGHL